LIFDSLPGAPRSRVVATLRDYLTCEYKAKYPNEPLRQYTKHNIFGNQVKVPIQNNYTDCGLFLLQYVEQFFKDPIKDFRIPIKTLNKWFQQELVTRKREEIAKLIEDLIKKTSPDEEVELPQLLFPTKDGKIIEQPAEPDVNENAFDDDEYVPTEEDMKEAEQNGVKTQSAGETKRVYFSKKRSLDKNDSTSGESGPKIPKFSAKVKP
jgi:sentrin-specific protease 7